MDINKIEASAKVATPIYTDLFGDRYMQGPYSQCELTQAQDVFVSTANPQAVLEMVALIRKQREVMQQALDVLSSIDYLNQPIGTEYAIKALEDVLK